MSIVCTFRETRTEPAEYEYTNPAECVICGEEHDLDDGRNFVTNDDETIVCTGSCYTTYKYQQLDIKFAEFLRDNKVADRVREIVANPTKEAVDALYAEVDAASTDEEEGYIDTNVVGCVVGTLEDLQNEIVNGSFESVQKAGEELLKYIAEAFTETKVK